MLFRSYLWYRAFTDRQQVPQGRCQNLDTAAKLHLSLLDSTLSGTHLLLMTGCWQRLPKLVGMMLFCSKNKGICHCRAAQSVDILIILLAELLVCSTGCVLTSKQYIRSVKVCPHFFVAFLRGNAHEHDLPTCSCSYILNVEMQHFCFLDTKVLRTATVGNTLFWG